MCHIIMWIGDEINRRAWLARHRPCGNLVVQF
jgi:hypothetical protein